MQILIDLLDSILQVVRVGDQKSTRFVSELSKPLSGFSRSKSSLRSNPFVIGPF